MESPTAVNATESPLLLKCLHHIAYNFASCTRNDQTETLLTGDLDGEEKSVSKCDVNPFTKLPSALLLQITNLLVRKGWLNIQQLEWLITSKTKMLSLSSMRIKSERTVSHFLQLAAASCPELTTLMMDYVEMCPVEYYKEFLPQFKDLHMLSVSGNFERFNDSCMRILGLHCKHLRELDVSECNVTDQGIEWLCGAPTDPEHQGHMFGQCKSLEKLTIDVKGITLKGVQIALRNSPHLRILEHDQVFKALIDMHENDVVLPKYALIKLEIYSSDLRSIPYGKCALRLVASLCPFLTRLSICEQEGFTDSNLLSLTALERLSKLKVSDVFDSDRRITFNGGLAPLLKARGSSLKVLKFKFISQVINLAVIIEYCPNLEILSLSVCKFSSSTELESGMAMRPSKLKKTDFMWEHLEKLNLQSVCDDDEDFDDFVIPPKVLLFILSRSPNLKHLDISLCGTIDDDLLQQVFLAHQFKSLENLSFAYCHSVTKDGINLFMNETNMLKKLIMDDCKLVKKNDIVGWREKAKTNNWDFCVFNF